MSMIGLTMPIVLPALLHHFSPDAGIVAQQEVRFGHGGIGRWAALTSPLFARFIKPRKVVFMYLWPIVR
jgi:hypothetical protein